MSKTKMIAVSPQVWESLRKFGEYGDSMNSIISKVLDKIDTMPNQKNKVTGGFEANTTQQLTQQSKSQADGASDNDY